MSGRSTRFKLGLICALLAAQAAGCAALRTPGLAGKDDPDEFRRRKQEAVQSFEQGRDEAQYRAAVARWQQGDAAGCRTSLEQLLARTPQHRNGRLLMAELLLWDAQIDAAAQLTQRLIDESPQEARAHHIMGLVLDARGDAAGATAELRRATELEPANEAYALSFLYATGQPPMP